MSARPSNGAGMLLDWRRDVEDALQTQHGRPTLDLRYREGLAFLLDKTYTGPVTVHVSEGVPKRIVVPNPEGW